MKQGRAIVVPGRMFGDRSKGQTMRIRQLTAAIFGVSPQHVHPEEGGRRLR